jgi:hypothetical protein
MAPDHDFVAIKVGDVNGNAIANATQVETRNAIGLLEFVTDERRVAPGEIVEVPIAAKDVMRILGYQLTLRTDGLILSDVTRGVCDLKMENIGMHEKAITMSWNAITPVPTSGILFTLTFRVMKDGNLSEMLGVSSNRQLTSAEAYNDKEELLNVILNFNHATEVSNEFALYQNEPNPFTERTVIGFDLPSAMHATLTVFDAYGRIVSSSEGNFIQGRNEIVLNAKESMTAGTYYYSLSAGEYTASKKLLLTKQ